MAAAGDRIDKFTLVRRLGTGGMGETWEAVRQAGHEFEQRVAIKLADPESLDCTEGLDSFRREAALAASLRHPNIAGVLDVDERAGYIVCELVDGADLRAVLRAAPGGRLEAPVLVHVIGQIARGLSHAHRRILRGRRSPVIHRDMSPGNVVVDYDGNIKIVDFGIAKACGGADAAEAVKGKLAYMAPEQAMGTRMDGRVDQYALGVIAYEALTGVRPNDGADDGETLACILGGKHVPLKRRLNQLDPGLAAVIERMLARHPDERFASMDALLDALVPYTPPITVHRQLIPLVVHARQPHTIVRENGQFISRPVAAEPLLRDRSVSESVAGASPLRQADAWSVRERSDTPSVPLALQRVEPLAQAALRAPGFDTAPESGPRASLPLQLVAAKDGAPAQLAEVRREPLRGNPDELRGLRPSSRSAPPKPQRGAKPHLPDGAQPGVLSVAGSLANTLRARASSHGRKTGRRRSLAGKAERRDKWAQRLRGWADRLLASRAFWQSLTVVGALLLSLVIWIAMSPEVLLSLVPAPAQPRLAAAPAGGPARLQPSPAAPQPTAAAPGVFVSTAALAEAERSAARADATRPEPSALARAEWARAELARGEPSGRAEAQRLEGASARRAELQPRSEASAGSSLRADGATRAEGAARAEVEPSDPAVATLNSVLVRVQVFPWGRVWIDQQLRGAVPPSFEISLPPGKHTIAVGREQPLETRVLEFQAGAMESVAFDIEGK
jgi:serine/threonine protein kinase